MISYFLILVLLPFIPSAIDLQNFFQRSHQLIGSSFGILGRNETFDYVVVGGGTAGLTIANRVAASGHSVAIVEAGSFYEITNGNLSQVPAYVGQFSSPDPTDIQPLVDWGILTTPQSGLLDRVVHYTQGKCLGGGSARNYLAYHRGTNGSYQKWADKIGDQSWTFDNVLQYFKRSVNFTPPTSDTTDQWGPYDPSAFSQTGGPLHVSYTSYFWPVSVVLAKGLEAIGLNRIPGLNSGRLLGYARVTATIDQRFGTRSSSETSFLEESLESSTLLQVYQSTLAKSIMFNSNKTATGVSVTTSGKNYTLNARKEVIISAGVFRTPQLLMASGIGPKATLNHLNISAVTIRPGVGQNMWDQPFMNLVYRVNVSTGSQLANTSDITYQSAILAEYLNNHTGPIAAILSDFLGWEKLPASSRANLTATDISALSQFSSDWPEIEYTANIASLDPTPEPGQYISIGVALVAPLSRGNVTIISPDTAVNPLVSPNWLLDKTDQHVAVQAVKRARQIASATGIVVQEIAPGDDVQTDDEILAWVRSVTIPIYHASATCSMGHPNDTMAVADSRGRVFGVSSLRIADASAFPLLPPGHCQATVYMLAEKIADDIIDSST